MNNIKEVSRKLVKPCIPTTPNLKNYKFSLTDEFLPPMEIGILLFYVSNDKQINFEESLAKVLVQFYPLAGRFIMKDSCVDCSDQGAELVIAEAPHVELATLIVERNLENLYGFLPRKNHQLDEVNYPILSIQITELNCSGVAIGISISHKIFDASSVSTFVAAWSNATNLGPERKMGISPTFDSSSVFPGMNQRKYTGSMIHGTQNHTNSVKRFTFNIEAITSLRSSLRPNEGISKVRVVCALIAKALIALDRAKLTRSRDCLLTMAVNMRERTVPPLHKHACGNLVLLSVDRYIAAVESDHEVGLQEMVDLIGDATSKTISDCAKILSLTQQERDDLIIKPLTTISKIFVSGEANVVSFTDYSKFGSYEADFGWGKPIWVSIVPQASRNVTVLMENREGNGIEAWLHLEKNDMRLFEQDEEIRLFCNLG
ncbi:hypothetical protein C2S52_015249 [Perilla frutescens var. hirtella]|nr:hypothetical protein C2S52_015249 [Perilla frutescens var. hirtella]